MVACGILRIAPLYTIDGSAAILLRKRHTVRCRHRRGAKHRNAEGLSRMPHAQHARGARLLGCCPRAFVVSVPKEAQLARHSVSHSAEEQLADSVQGSAHPMDEQPSISGLISPDADGAHLAQPDGSHSAGEHPQSTDSDQTDLATQQQNDAEIGYLVRLRLSQTHPPAAQDLASQSESAKELFTQWNQL